MKQALTGIFFGVALGMAVSALIVGLRQHDSCKTRLTTSYVSACLDGKAQKLKELIK
ncbi:hypothetical protein [Bradyrhizobium sp. SZCCHNR3118]|uniref:hypothetical protein n=1 Tax=Bradyrhizobium sp. SZCCHNR3118 TaxID=3057468 RepID=UPI0029169F42|nr:hypothetical protein [Bradyrhizobium sp. SZCCHNR3118]